MACVRTKKKGGKPRPALKRRLEMKENINQNGQTVKPFNGTRGIFIPYSLIDSLHGDYYAAAIVSQLFYWMQMPENENMWRYQTMKELAKQLRMEYRTFFNHIKKLRKAGIITIEEHGSYKIVKLKKEIFEHMDIDEVAETVEKISTDEKFSTDEKISTDSCKNFNSTVEKFSTDSCKIFNSDSPQPLEQQGKAKALDYNEINNEINEIKNMIDRYKSNDSRIHEQEPTDIRKVLKQSQPSESNTRPYLVFESQIVRHLIELGFPRKSLRSEDDRKELDEILAKCDENVSVMLQKLETLAKERHIRLYEYGGKISLQKLRERWDDLTVEVQFSPEMADWRYREYAVYCIRNNYDDRQIVMMAKGVCYCYSLPRSEVYNVAKKLRQIIEELLREEKRRENVRPNLGIDYGSLVQKFPT